MRDPTTASVHPVGPRVARLFAVVAMAALAAACGGGGGGSPDTGTAPPPPPPPAPPPAPVLQSALSTAQPGELVSYFKTKMQQRAAQGLGTSEATTGGGPVFISAPVTSAAPAVSGTTLQEAGVDEDDLLKADGANLYALHPSYQLDAQPVAPTLTAERRQADGTLAGKTTLTLNAEYAPQGMFVANAGARLAVVSRKPNYDAFIALGAPALSILPPTDKPAERRVALELFNVADGKPAAASRIEVDGSLVGTRMIGNVLYVVSTWSPDLVRYAIPANATSAQAAAVVANLSAGELLPKIRIDGGAAQNLVNESDCMLQSTNASLNLTLTTVTAFDLAAAGAPRASRCFVGGVETLYMSPTNVYLTSSRQYWVGGDARITVFPATSKTDIHKFALQGLEVTYRGSGEVPGHLGWDAEKKPYRLSEHNGDLRVVSFTGQTGWIGTPASATATPAPSPATLTVLRESPTGLQAVATLPNAQRPEAIGKSGEQVYAVHFAGAQAYVVTFRRTDPLYVLDLSNPVDPRVVGELSVPGYSDYVYPLANGKLLGVGKDATTDGRVTGLRVSLFDVANPAQPRQLASRTLGQAGSMTALDTSRHGINLFPQGAQVQVALPVRVAEANFRTAYQGLARYVVDTAAGTLDEKPVAIAVRFDGTLADSAKYGKFDLAKERSVQSSQGAYYLSGGAVTFVP